MLSLSPDYVPTWQFRHALRELIQNGLDQARQNSQSKLILDYDEQKKTLRVGATNCNLSRRTLLLGCTDKATDPNMIGSFGEGYKLALLVLCRSGYNVVVSTGNEIWCPFIEYNSDLNSNVLCVKIERVEDAISDILFVVSGVTTECLEFSLEEMYLSDAEDNSTIPDKPGRVYVGGLYVCTVPGLHDGYNFAPGVIKLNRDRDMVSSFDVFLATSQLWQHHPDIERFFYHLKNKHEDVKYADYVPPTTAQRLLAYYRNEHGDAIPVNTQAEILMAQDEGRQFVLVSEPCRNILWRAGHFLFDRKAQPRPYDVLSTWHQKYSAFLSGSKDAADSFVPILVRSKSWKL